MIKLNNIKNRAGISTVVGSVFFIIIFTIASSYVLFSMNQLDKFGETIISKSQDDRNIQQEEFKIMSVTKDNNKFNITVQNTGQIPINITRLWVQNKTDPTWPISKYTVNQMVPPGQSLVKIGQNLPLTVLSTQAYDLTVATARGNTNEAMVNSASSKPLNLQLFVLPETVPTGFTTTLLFAVTNNMSNNALLTNLKPNLLVTPNGAVATIVSGPEPSEYKFLDKGDTAYFKWVYTITGNAGQKVNFQTSLQNGYLGNSVSRNVTINSIQSSNYKTVMSGGLTGTYTSTSQNYLRIGGDSAVSTTYNLKSITMPISGNFTKLYVSKGTGDAHATLTLYKNGSATSLSCQTGSSSPSSCSDIIDSISVVSGDTVAMGIKMSNTDPSGDITYALEFNPS